EYARKGRGPFVDNMRADKIVTGLAQAYLAGTGFATDLPSGWTAFLKTAGAGALPDIQLIFRAVPISAAPWFPGVRKPFADGFAVRVALLRPESRGRISLRSSDPADKIRIHQNVLQTHNDRRVIKDGLRLIREFAQRSELKDFIAAELAPGPENWSEPALDAHV